MKQPNKQNESVPEPEGISVQDCEDQGSEIGIDLSIYDPNNGEQGTEKADPIAGLSDLYVPAKGAESPGPEQIDELGESEIADALLEMGKLTANQHESLLGKLAGASNSGSDNTVMLLLKERIVGADDILEARAKIHGLEFEHINSQSVDKEAFEKLDIGVIENDFLCPLRIEGDCLVIATCDLGNVESLDRLKNQAGMNVRLVVCPSEEITEVCESLSDHTDDGDIDDIINDMIDVEVVQEIEDDGEDLEEMAGQSPVIKFVNFLISNAIHEGASDIHMEPKKKFTRIRYRIDGVLFEMKRSPLKMHPAIVSRIKIMANLDISERRLPQDGKISVIVGGRGVDLRVSILPTNRGEKVVIRVLDSQSIVRGLDELGMEPEVMEAFGEQIKEPHGILLVTGPTGSGKSTTLYTALGQMDNEKFNVSTVEDPVEYELGFCNQVQANERIGLTFASALRSLLRQDPDIIMIGEIRDGETARISVQAALTGHLVLSTLHTNDAASSITRLVDIGVDAYLIAASLNGILAQRLVRKICPKCKENYAVTDTVKKYISKTGIKSGELFHGAGCDNCRGSGYIGRLGIYELLIVDERFKNVIGKDPSASNMQRLFRESGGSSLFDDGIKKVRQGLTTIEEVVRVTQMHDGNEE
ncbi:GspE/PulE family protein [Planctomycetota bacterium]